MNLVEKALAEGSSTLSEAESKELLAQHGVPIGHQALLNTVDEALAFVEKAGYPVALKGCGRNILHKTEMGLVRLNIDNEEKLKNTFEDLSSKLPAGADGILISPMVDTKREFIAGLSTDPHFGPVVMFGLGGIFTEALKDVVFRVAPITRADAMEMLEGIRSKALLDDIRGLPAVNRDALCDILMAVSDLATNVKGIEEIDINPILIDKNMPIAADALIKIA